MLFWEDVIGNLSKRFSAPDFKAPFSFYVVDKRYSRLVYFDREQGTTVIQIYKSGTDKTPFDVGDL